jgi:hypothetical protein
MIFWSLLKDQYSSHSCHNCLHLNKISKMQQIFLKILPVLFNMFTTSLSVGNSNPQPWVLNARVLLMCCYLTYVRYNTLRGGTLITSPVKCGSKCVNRLWPSSLKCCQKMNITLYWDMILCRLVNNNWCFRGAYCFHLQGKRMVMLYQTTEHHIPEDINITVTTVRILISHSQKLLESNAAINRKLSKQNDILSCHMYEYIILRLTKTNG